MSVSWFDYQAGTAAKSEGSKVATELDDVLRTVGGRVVYARRDLFESHASATVRIVTAQFRFDLLLVVAGDRYYRVQAAVGLNEPPLEFNRGQKFLRSFKITD